MKDLGKPTIDLLLATKAVVERDLAQGFISEQRLRFTIEARKRAAPELAEKGLSTRQIARITGASQTTIVRDLGDANGSEREPNGSPTTRELLSQSDQNDWRTPRKFLDAAREAKACAWALLVAVTELEPPSEMEDHP